MKPRKRRELTRRRRAHRLTKRFRVACDESNNPPETREAQVIVADVWIYLPG